MDIAAEGELVGTVVPCVDMVAGGFGEQDMRVFVVGECCSFY